MDMKNDKAEQIAINIHELLSWAPLQMAVGPTLLMPGPCLKGWVAGPLL